MEWVSLALQGPADFAAGDLHNVTTAQGQLTLSPEASIDPEDPNDGILGVFTSTVAESATPFSAIRLDYDGVVPGGAGLTVEVRIRYGARWSEWQELGGSGQAFSAPRLANAAQYRATLRAPAQGTSPALSSVAIQVRPTSGGEEAQYEAMATRPTVRLYGTREGLVGRTTANGHRIVERDRFVALPSKKALNPRDRTDYQVEVAYRGKKVTLPVWDVGPWNSKDDFWNSPREMFNDLPRFKPQVNAAFYDNYNGGNDQYGRPVIYPAAIDIADGAFWDDLGMKSSDWVDVTFLWVDAAAPPLVPMPPVVPKAGPIPKPIFGGGSSEAPPAPPTPTPIPKTWYFAEGSTNKPFDTWLLLQNPDPAPANVKITYMLPKGGQQIGNYQLKPSSRTSLFLNSIVPNTEVSTLIESDRYILAERAVYFSGEGHDTTGVINPDTSWFFAEGNTKPGYDTWILLQNPNTTPATATLTFYKEDGTTATHKMLVPHVSRESLLVNLIVPDALVGTRVEADKPIVAERAVYRDRRAGSASMGARDLSMTWYFAEGNTREGFDTWLLMLNPNDTPATATVTFLREEAAPITKQYTLPARSRFTVSVNKEAPWARVGAKIESSAPIVAERTVYFAGGAASHNSVASPVLSKLWYLPEGSTAKPFSENVLIVNPGDKDANVTITFMKEDGGTIEKRYTIKPISRFTVEVNGVVPDTALSTKVTSDQPIVVERSMYFNEWKAGHSAMGIPK